MKISEVIEMLERQKELNGDIKTTMIATLCPIGYSMGESKVMEDVFESTVESCHVLTEGKFGKRLMIQWQL